MKRLSLLAFAVGLVALGRAPMAQAPLKDLAEFPGSVLKWLRTAEPILQREHLNEDDFTVSVIDGGKSVYVSLTPVHLPEGARDGVGYQIEISKTDLKILSAHYVR
jgi:hypothetical protein